MYTCIILVLIVLKYQIIFFYEEKVSGKEAKGWAEAF